MSAIFLSNGIVHFEVLGRGRPLIFLHGWVGSWRYWIPSMQAASHASRAYALDLWGFGDTAKDPARYLLRHQVSLLVEFLEKMGIGKISLVGHGLGAGVALLYANQKPGGVDRVMAVSFPLEKGALHPRLQSAAPLELAEWLLGKNQATEAVRNEAPKADVQAIQSSLNQLQNIDIPSLTLQLSLPCLWVHGQNDQLVPLPHPTDIAKDAEHIHSIVFENSGHFPMLDEPSKFNRLLADFLSLDSGESPQKLQVKEEWKRRVR